MPPAARAKSVRHVRWIRHFDGLSAGGKHTRIKGLNRDKIKELILNHIRDGKPSRLADLISGFMEYKPKDISNILQELQKSGKIIHEGSSKKGYWRVGQ